KIYFSPRGESSDFFRGVFLSCQFHDGGWLIVRWDKYNAQPFQAGRLWLDKNPWHVDPPYPPAQKSPGSTAPYRNHLKLQLALFLFLVFERRPLHPDQKCTPLQIQNTRRAVCARSNLQ